MRTSLSLVPLLVAVLACGRGDDAADTTAADSAAASAAAAADSGRGLGEGDFAGTWSGQAMMEGSDSVVARFTQTCAQGTCRGVLEGTTDTSTSSYRIEGDSIVGSSAPYTHPDFDARVVDAYVLRILGDSAVGTGMVKLADRDSVLVRMRLRGTRTMAAR